MTTLRRIKKGRGEGTSGRRREGPRTVKEIHQVARLRGKGFVKSHPPPPGPCLRRGGRVKGPAPHCGLLGLASSRWVKFHCIQRSKFRRYAVKGRGGRCYDGRSTIMQEAVWAGRARQGRRSVTGKLEHSLGLLTQIGLRRGGRGMSKEGRSRGTLGAA